MRARGGAMRCSVGVLGIGTVAVMVMLGVLCNYGSALQPAAPGNPFSVVAYQAMVEGPNDTSGQQAFSTQAERRAVLDQEWHEAMRVSCTPASPFAAPAPWRPAC